jgi:membrane-bound lytic murein transglycosylase A
VPGLLRPLAAVLVTFALAACPPAPETEEPDGPRFEPVGFAALDGWRADAHEEALSAFSRSCAALQKRGPETELPGAFAPSRVADWLPACAAATAVPPDAASARAFFEAWFVPVRVRLPDAATGLFTGYYEPLLHGARAPAGPYRHPLYGRPPELVAVDLGRFAADLDGRSIAGRVEEGRLVPFADRAAIDAGALAGRGLELFWVDDPIALFFLHIQGSGRVRLADGQEVRVGYADQNGHVYRAIGRDLVEWQELRPEEVSLQSIRDWLRAHPERAPELMERNPSYVFFRELGPAAAGLGPPGAQGVPLQPGRSIAVDRRHVAYGTPVWVETTAPYPEGEQPLRRLMIAQDTGGAIRGHVRGDVFWGAGEAAEWIAGHMQSRGTWYLLLPKDTVPMG